MCEAGCLQVLTSAILDFFRPFLDHHGLNFRPSRSIKKKEIKPKLQSTAGTRFSQSENSALESQLSLNLHFPIFFCHLDVNPAESTSIVSRQRVLACSHQ